MFDFVGVLVLTALAALFGFLVTRAWGAKNAVLKWGGVTVTGLLTLILIALLVFSLIGFYKLNAQHDNPVSEVKVAGTPEQIARGEKLVKICLGCHSPNGQLPLTGQNFFAEGGPPIGILYAPNLTPTHLKDWSDGEIIRAIREGVHKNGRALIIMPAEVFRHLSSEDVQSLVAFLRAQPAVEPDTSPTQFNTLGALFTNLGPFQTRQEPVGNVTAPPEGPTADYGAYLVSVIGCTSCHGANLEGIDPSQTNGPPPGPNLTRVIPNWTEEEFMTFFRTGQLPSGSTIGELMPWKDINDFATDDDLKAMYAYLHSLPPVEGP